MKYFMIGILLIGQNLYSSARRSSIHVTPAEKRYQESLRRYDSSKDVRLQGKTLPPLTRKNLERNSLSLPKYKKGFSIPQNPNLIPPIDMSQLNKLRHSRKPNYDGHD